MLLVDLCSQITLTRLKVPLPKAINLNRKNLASLSLLVNNHKANLSAKSKRKPTVHRTISKC